MPSAFSPNKGYELQATGENQNTWGIKLDAVESIVDLNFGGRLNLSVAGNTDVTVNATQAENVAHFLTGVLTGNINYNLPNVGSFYIITNNTTGAFNLTLQNVGGGTGIVIPQGSTYVVFTNPDGPSILLVAAPAAAGTAIPGSLFNAPTTTGINTVLASFAPAPAALTAGTILGVIIGNTNTGAATFTPNALAAKAITKFGGGALIGGELQATAFVLLGYDGTQWQILSTLIDDGSQLWGGTSTGSSTAQVITLPVAPGAWKAGQILNWKSGFVAGAGLTVNPNSLGAKTVLRSDGSAITVGDFQVGTNLSGMFDGTNVTLITEVQGVGRALNLAKGAAVASAATTDIWSPEDGNLLHITGNTGPITSFGNAPQPGAHRIVIFDSNPTVTNNASIVTGTGGNIAVTANSMYLIVADSTSKVYMIGIPSSIAVGSVYTNAVLLTGSGNWAVPAGVTSVMNLCMGGGASGGGATTSGTGGPSAYGSGGSPGELSTAIMAVTPAANIAYTSGAGGSAPSNGANGNDGSGSTFGGNSANGGKGGKNANQTNSGTDTAAGAAEPQAAPIVPLGTPTVVKIASKTRGSDASTAAGATQGPNSPWGTGGAANNGGNGAAASGYGAAGGGAGITAASGFSFHGGAGAPGANVVLY